MNSNDKIIENTTCFEEHRKRDLACNKQSCRNWMNCPAQLNCAVVAVNDGEMRTLQEIGDIFGVTRMRICQIEKVILKKLRDGISQTYS
jgi:hypothetical protein